MIFAGLQCATGSSGVNWGILETADLIGSRYTTMLQLRLTASRVKQPLDEGW